MAYTRIFTEKKKTTGYKRIFGDKNTTQPKNNIGPRRDFTPTVKKTDPFSYEVAKPLLTSKIKDKDIKNVLNYYKPGPRIIPRDTALKFRTYSSGETLSAKKTSQKSYGDILSDRQKEAEKELKKEKNAQNFRASQYSTQLGTSLTSGKKQEDFNMTGLGQDKLYERNQDVRRAKVTKNLYEDLKDNDFNEGFFDAIIDSWERNKEGLIPIAHSAVATEDKELAIEALQKRKDGTKLTEREKTSIDKAQLEYQDNRNPKSRGYNIGKAVYAMPAYIGDIAIMSKAFGINKIAGLATIPKLLKIPAVLGSAGASGALNMFAVKENYTDRRLTKEIENITDKVTDGKTKDFLKSMGSVGIEYATERAGMFLPLGKLKKLILGSYASKFNILPKQFKAIAESLGWNGILEEIFEEQLGQPFQDWLEGQQYKNPITTPEGRERLLTEFLTILTFGAIAGGGARLAYESAKQVERGIGAYKNLTPQERQAGFAKNPFAEDSKPIIGTIADLKKEIAPKEGTPIAELKKELAPKTDNSLKAFKKEIGYKEEVKPFPELGKEATEKTTDLELEAKKAIAEGKSVEEFVSKIQSLSEIRYDIDKNKPKLDYSKLKLGRSNLYEVEDFIKRAKEHLVETQKPVRTGSGKEVVAQREKDIAFVKNTIKEYENDKKIIEAYKKENSDYNKPQVSEVRFSKVLDRLIKDGKIKESDRNLIIQVKASNITTKSQLEQIYKEAQAKQATEKSSTAKQAVEKKETKIADKKEVKDTISNGEIEARKQSVATEKLKADNKISPDDTNYWATPIEGEPKTQIPTQTDSNGIQIEDGDVIEFSAQLDENKKGRTTIRWNKPYIANASGKRVEGGWVGNGSLPNKIPFTIVERGGKAITTKQLTDIYNKAKPTTAKQAVGKKELPKVEKVEVKEIKSTELETKKAFSRHYERMKDINPILDGDGIEIGKESQKKELDWARNYIQRNPQSAIQMAYGTKPILAGHNKQILSGAVYASLKAEGNIELADEIAKKISLRLTEAARTMAAAKMDLHPAEKPQIESKITEERLKALGKKLGETDPNKMVEKAKEYTRSKTKKITKNVKTEQAKTTTEQLQEVDDLINSLLC